MLIHGGSGFMKDYACERVYRDARITSIYEGTTQLQVVAAIRHVTTGTYSAMMEDYASQPVSDELKPVADTLSALAAKYNEAVEKINAVADTTYTDFMARRLVEMAGNIVMSWLLVTDATRYSSESMTRSAKVYSKIAQAEVEKHLEFIANFTPDQIELYKQA